MNSIVLRMLQWMRPVARRLPEHVKRPLREWLRRRLAGTRQRKPAACASSDPAYRARIAEEAWIFEGQVEVHDLPPIYHYWSNRWLRPQVEAFGFSNPDQFFALYFAHACADALAAGHPARFASLGCGNCDTEVRVARLLIERGLLDFTIDCVDINEAMLARGRRLAIDEGVGDYIVPARGDFNDWQPHGRYDAVLANQSLHHVLNLEGLFSAIDTALTAEGRFVTSDVIGRNGHMRWPEAAAIVQEFWQELPKAYRRNMQLRRDEPRFLEWDCSVAGFEGIRAQDILPLLVERFDFELFFGYGNLIDPFIDRSFGPNFDADATWDREFIDRVHARDEAEMLAGRITPTHVLAVLRRRPYAGPRHFRTGLAPEDCMRRA
jgi:SAM-dependent methyltransferase